MQLIPDSEQVLLGLALADDVSNELRDGLASGHALTDAEHHAELNAISVKVAVVANSHVVHERGC